MITQDLLIELAVWLVACIIADKINSDYIFRACDLYLIYVLSGHSWRITIPVFVAVFSLLKVWKWIGEFLQEVLFPEAKRRFRDRL